MYPITISNMSRDNVYHHPARISGIPAPHCFKNDELYSGEHTTDICVYKLRQGTLDDQCGMEST